MLLTNSGNYNPGVSLAQMMQADLAKIGIKLNLKIMELAAWNQAALALAQPFVRSSSVGFNNMDPSTMFTFSNVWTPQGNPEGFSDPLYTDLVQRMSSEPDAAKRKAIFDQMNDFILDQAFNVGVTTNPVFTATRGNVQGTYYSQNGLRNYEAIWFDR